MPTLTLASCASAVPMGAQVYQEEIAVRAARALEAVASGWTVERMVLRSLRSPLAGTHRLPMGWTISASAPARRRLGRLLHPGSGLVHRMDLEVPPADGRDVVTVHDVVAWTHDDERHAPPAAAEEVRRARAVICVSRFAAEEVSALLGVPDPVVVHNGVDARFLGAVPDPAVTRGLGLRSPYVLHAGGATKRKNLEALADAWPRIHSSRPDLVLALAGPEHPRRTALFGGLPGVTLLGRVADAVVPALVAGAAVVVVPSLHEGFGLPALEGMAAGVPVVAARTSSLPEVVGDAGILVEPTGEDLAQGVLWAASGDAAVARIAAQGRLRAADFTWERSAAGHAAVWARVA